ncbi:MAG TPA: type II toxin-antitoxin system VapC family toxin [Saprospiraceae bacterium]|nr:type II toxin-antitoxin system VapC family toxin [Saprospiraceae bacterium]
MDRYLLDTDICIFYLKGRFGLHKKIKEVGIENCFVSEITIAELTFGAYKSARKETHLQDVKNIAVLFEIVPIYGSITRFAQEKVRLHGIGTPIPDFDLLISSTAVANDMILVTNNIKHMATIENIKIENWTLAEDNSYAKE